MKNERKLSVNYRFDFILPYHRAGFRYAAVFSVKFLIKLKVKGKKHNEENTNVRKDL